MTPEEQQELNQCVHRIAQLLYRDAEDQGLPMSRLAAIEATVREQLQAQVSLQIGIFLSTQPALQQQERISAH